MFAKLNGLKGFQAKAGTWFRTNVMASRKSQAIFIVAVAAVAVVLGPVTVAALSGGGALPLVSFNEDRAMGFEQQLVSFGPRYSGTANEANTADFVASEFTAAGLKDVKVEDYNELLWEPATAEISLVPYGPLGRLPSVTQSPIAFEHKVDFVVQGFSGSRSGGFRGDLLPFWANGNGANVSDFSGGSGRACIVQWSEASISGNWVLFNNSWQAGCAALLAHNQLYAPELNYTPISKGTPQPTQWPDPNYPDIPFAAMSKSMGDEIKAHSNGWKLRINFQITIEQRVIHVVTGDVKGSVDPTRFVMLGAHMDNVYTNNGAVDDGVGTTTILELAHQLAATTPKYTIRLATFAGEEQGLFGSADWRDAHADEVNKSMIAMFQFDMNHIDVERCSEMNFWTNDNSTLPKLQESERKVREGNPAYQKFNPNVQWADVSHQGSDMAVFAAWGIPAFFAYGCGSWEYHTYLDDINRVTMPSLAYSGRVFASVALWLANK